ncbi:zinc finger domain-containing protein [Streptomyces sp. NPDC055817]
MEECKEAEAERERQAEKRRQQEAVQRRLDLIRILTVACPHCSAPAAALCRSARGVGRLLHRARRQLAGVDGPKEFVLEATSYRSGASQPSVHADLREVLGDPLVDRTAEAQPRYAAGLEAEAQRKVHDAKRALWLAEGSREEIILAQACSDCGAEPGAACSRAGRGWGTRAHAERIDAAMEDSA